MVAPAERDGPRPPCRPGEVLEVLFQGWQTRRQLGLRGIESRGHKEDQRWGSGGSPQWPCPRQDCRDRRYIKNGFSKLCTCPGRSASCRGTCPAGRMVAPSSGGPPCRGFPLLRDLELPRPICEVEWSRFLFIDCRTHLGTAPGRGSCQPSWPGWP